MPKIGVQIQKTRRKRIKEYCGLTAKSLGAQPWSGFATLFCRSLSEFLLGKQLAFKTFPAELSAIVYLERRVLPDGRIALSRDRSAAYYNPLALYHLQPGSFSMLNQFWSQLISAHVTTTDHWIYL